MRHDLAVERADDAVRVGGDIADRVPLVRVEDPAVPVEDLHALDPRVGEHAGLKAVVELAQSLRAHRALQVGRREVGLDGRARDQSGDLLGLALGARLDLALEQEAKRGGEQCEHGHAQHAEACEQGQPGQPQ
jgi:hypothetical protein